MLSLNGALRTCKVEQGWASRIESDRFENPNLMVCPVWNGLDNAGRPVAPDSFYTKRAGCNSANDRVEVENAQRPQYMEYIQLNAAGITAPLYGSTNMHAADSLVQTKTMDDTALVTGRFGAAGPNVQGAVLGTCPIYAMNEAMSQEAQAYRMVQNAQNGVQSYNLKRRSGN